MTIEIRVRGFYTCDEGMDLIPSRTFTAPDDLSEPLDVAKIVKAIANDVKDFPAAGVRPMTKEEAEDYRAREGAEEGEGWEEVSLD